MLNFLGRSHRHRHCDGLSRRDALRVGGLGLAGLGLSDILRLRAHGSGSDKPRPKSIIMVWLDGGPTQLDLYDLKPDAPVEIRGEFKPIQTNVAGFDLCELMPTTAA